MRCAHEVLLTQVPEPHAGSRTHVVESCDVGIHLLVSHSKYGGSPQVHPPWHLLQVIGRALAVSQ